MKTIKDVKTGTYSIVEIDEIQIDIMNYIIDTIHRHTYYDVASSRYEINSKEVKGIFDKEEYSALKSIVL